VIIHGLLAFDFASGMVNRRGAEDAEKARSGYHLEQILSEPGIDAVKND